MMPKAWSSIEEVPYCFARSSVKLQGRMALKIVEFDPDWAILDCNSNLNSPMGTKWCTKLEVAQKRCHIVFSCDQAALRTLLSVRLSVCPSVRHTFLTMFPSSYNHEIFRSYYHGQKWCPCKRSRSKRSKQILTQIERFRTLNSSLNSLMAMKWCTKLDVA